MGIVWLARPSLPFPTCGRLGNIQSHGATILSIAQECNASKVKREGFTSTSQHPFSGIILYTGTVDIDFRLTIMCCGKINPLVVDEA